MEIGAKHYQNKTIRVEKMSIQYYTNLTLHLYFLCRRKSA
jgi:hypothetical protein